MILKCILPITGDQKEKIKDISDYLRPHLMHDTVLQFETLEYGFPSVETELQGMFNGTQTVMLVKNLSPDECDGVFIDCFDDPGVYACREMGNLPVIGPYQAAICSALQLSDRIGIITTDEAGILNEEKKAQSFGLTGKIVSICAMDLPVAGIREEKEKVLHDLEALCEEMCC
ncbi:MAG: aspartate/glutamate racemase family protein [Anaerovoracaceae bacterium]